MSKKKLPAVRVSESPGASTLSKAQKLFNKRIQQIEIKRKLLEAWQATISEYQAQYAKEVDPLTEQLNRHKKEMVILLDKACSDKRVTKTEKAKISHFVRSISSELISEYGYTDLKEIYNRHSESDIDANEGDDQGLMKLMFENILGVSLGEDFKAGSTEEMMGHIGEKIKEKIVQEKEDSQKKAEQKPKRKKSAAAIAKEAKAQEEAKNISQSVREVYRKLASVLHPDLEQDAVERERKTEMMKRANILYGNKDLLGLLELQLEIEQIDQHKIDTISEERLTYYNKVLAEQYAELCDEIQRTEMSFCFRFNMPPIFSLSPDTVIHRLKNDIKDLKSSIDEILNDLVSFQDVKNIKSWLKKIRRTGLSKRNRDTEFMLEGLFGFR